MREGERVVVLAYVKKDTGGDMVEVESRWSNTTAWVSRKDIEHKKKMSLTGLDEAVENWMLENWDEAKLALTKAYWESYDNNLSKVNA